MHTRYTTHIIEPCRHHQKQSVMSLKSRSIFKTT